MVGLDTCSYRMACKTVLGDREFSLTQKRYQAKSHLLDLYKEQYETIQKDASSASSSAKNATPDAAKNVPKKQALTKSATAKKTTRGGSTGSIFDLEDSIQKPPTEPGAED